MTGGHLVAGRACPVAVAPAILRVARAWPAAVRQHGRQVQSGSCLLHLAAFFPLWLVSPVRSAHLPRRAMVSRASRRGRRRWKTPAMPDERPGATAMMHITDI